MEKPSYKYKTSVVTVKFTLTILELGEFGEMVIQLKGGMGVGRCNTQYTDINEKVNTGRFCRDVKSVNEGNPV